MRNVGGQTILSEAEEQIIVENIDTACRWRFPLTANDLRALVKSYLDGQGVQKFKKNNWAGKDWMRGFLCRHR